MRLRFLTGMMVIAVLAATTAAGATDYVVIGVTGDAGYKAGDTLDDTATVTLAADTGLSLIASTGKKIDIQGPYAATLAQAAADQSGAAPVAAAEDTSLSSLAALFSDESTSDKSLGTYRAVGSPRVQDGRINPWMIDVGKSGTRCYQDDAEIFIWRSRDKKRRVMVLTDIASGTPTEVKWAMRTQHLPWPVAATLSDGGSYKIEIVGRRRVRRIALVKVPGGLPTPLHTAAWMTEHDCKDQARALVLSLKADVTVGGTQ